MIKEKTGTEIMLLLMPIRKLTRSLITRPSFFSEKWLYHKSLSSCSPEWIDLLSDDVMHCAPNVSNRTENLVLWKLFCAVLLNNSLAQDQLTSLMGKTFKCVTKNNNFHKIKIRELSRQINVILKNFQYVLAVCGGPF